MYGAARRCAGGQSTKNHSLKGPPLKNTMICGVLLLFLLPPPISAQSQTSQSPHELNELILLPRHPGQPANWRAESIVEAAQARVPNPNQVLALQRAGHPTAARFVVADRMHDDIRASRTDQDPEERLQRYVVLKYPTHQAAEAAYRKLVGDTGSLSVEWNAEFEFSASPSDPMYFPDIYNENEKNYQWGLHDPMNFQGAWDKTWGTALVAIIDSGIQQNHPDLTQAFRPQFAYSVNGDVGVDESLNAATGFRGHGTHVAGIIAANANDPSRPIGLLNPPASGVAGGCWSCGLVVIRSSSTTGASTNATIAAGINRAVISGAQVISISLVSGAGDCSLAGLSSMCTAIQFANTRDVVIIASSGNRNLGAVQFPASDSRVMPVAGIDNVGNRWTESADFGSPRGASLTSSGVAAPAKDILSTFYTNFDWNRWSRCGDRNLFEHDPAYQSPQFPDIGYGDQAGPGFGRCTGNSMAAPHVAAIAALVRSANPIATQASVRANIRTSGSHANAPTAELGAGVPNARLAVVAAMPSANRQIPLFSSLEHWDYRYTVSPQMAAAFATGDFNIAFPITFDKLLAYSHVGNSVSEMPLLPGTSVAPKAQLRVFAGPVNPLNGSQKLVPLIRVSKRVGNGVTKGEIAYDTSETRAQALLNGGYRLDGVEGFLYSPQYPQPNGTVRVYRASNPATMDNGVFPETMIPAGYTADVHLLGYAMSNGK